MSQPPDNQNNLLIAVVLSMAVMLGWQYFYAGPQMKAQQEKAAREKQEQVEKQASPSVAAPPAADRAAPAAPPAFVPAATREEAIARSPRIAIETPSLKGSIALKGGFIDDLTLKSYRQTVNPASPNVTLLSPLDGPNAYFAEFGWNAPRNATQKVPDGETLWTVEGGATSLTPAAPVKLTWNNGQGLVFRRTIAIDDHYMFTITDEVENTTSGDVAVAPFARIYRVGKPKTQVIGVLHEGLIGVPGDEGLVEITYDKALKEEGVHKYDGKTAGWLGITDHYWATALIPDQKQPYDATFEGRKAAGGKDLFTVDYSRPSVVIPAGKTERVDGHLYAGAKQVKLVEAYEKDIGILKFDLLIDWGWFYFITKPLYYLIDFLYGILGNFGLAILAVTVLVKAAFFPLANKSYEAMAKMKKLQPEMEKLREQFKDDKARQQQELMKLYQEKKINPLAGCLPILVQIPVFFALYKVLYVSIDMRHAPFFGWIKDLSAADPTSLFNLFGLLPFAVPEFLHVGIWPIIMGLTMWLQMQLNPPQPDPVQQQIFAWMPLLFTFLLATFPAGLVIYWAWNNILSIAQQWYISHKQGADVHLMNNLNRTFAPVRRLLGKTDTKT
jgi:YidC/Oxa1 family membrane protein insertase